MEQWASRSQGGAEGPYSCVNTWQVECHKDRGADGTGIGDPLMAAPVQKARAALTPGTKEVEDSG